MLSVVIITFNEEENVGRCLESIKDIADEIIVVDSFSKDETKSICQQFNVRFIEQPFLGYIEQKNFAFKLATHNYILSLDADEALSSALLLKIKEEKEKGFPSDAYEMNRRNNFFGKWMKYGVLYPDKKVRLVNKNIAFWGGRNPHDKLVLKKNVLVKRLKTDIIHYSFRSKEDHFKKIEKYSSLGAESLFVSGEKYYILKMMFSPIWRFIKSYIYKLGFLDGWQGLMFSYYSAKESYLKYSKFRKMLRVT